MKIITYARELKTRRLVDTPRIEVPDIYPNGFEWASKIRELPELKKFYSTVYIQEDTA